MPSIFLFYDFTYHVLNMSIRKNRREYMTQTDFLRRKFNNKLEENLVREIVHLYPLLQPLISMNVSVVIYGRGYSCNICHSYLKGVDTFT